MELFVQLLIMVGATALAVLLIWRILKNRPATPSRNASPTVVKAFRLLQEARDGNMNSWMILEEMIGRNPVLRQTLRLRQEEETRLKQQAQNRAAQDLVNDIASRSVPDSAEVVDIPRGDEIKETTAQRVSSIQEALMQWRSQKNAATAALLKAELDGYEVPENLLSPQEIRELELA